jgi:hypothetical protein
LRVTDRAEELTNDLNEARRAVAGVTPHATQFQLREERVHRLGTAIPIHVDGRRNVTV